MKKEALFVVVGLLIGAFLSACAPSQVGPDAQAIETNTQAVETNAQAVEHYNRGVENQQQGKFDLAIEEYTEAIALDPQYADSYNKRGLAYVAKGDLDRAIADFDRAIALDPQYVDPYTNRGNAYYAKGEFDRAIADHDQAIALDPQLALSYTNRGAAYGAKGDLDRAIADYDQAIALDPQLALAYNYRANANDDKGEFDLAIADYGQAIALDPEYAEAYYDRGIAYGRKAEFDRAIADYDQAIALDPEYAEAYTNRGVAYYAKGDPDRAIADFDQAIALDPEHVAAYYNRGVAYGSKGDLDSAIASYDQAIAHNPEYAEAYTNRGAAYFGKGDLDRAIADFDQTIALDPENAIAYLNRGLVYVVMGKVEAASDLARAIELGLDAGTKQFALEKLEELGRTAPETGALVTLVARCRAETPREDWRCNNLLFGVAEVNADLEAAGDPRRVVLKTIQHSPSFGDIMQEFALAYEDGQAPDIVLTGHEFIGAEATAGRIISIESMIGDYPEFDSMIEGLWASVTFKGERWGIPQDTEARPIYWDKNLLAQVPGWNAARVEGLTDEITAGKFTLSDMLDTAEAAVEAGVVDSGMGFWMRPLNGPDFTALYYAYGGETIDADTGKLVYDTAAGLKFYQFFERGLTGDGAHSFLTGDWGGSFHPNVSGGKVLFWAGGTWQWADWAYRWTTDLGGQDYQFDNWGYGLYPAAEGGSPSTLSHPLAYLISAQTKHPDLALALIAKATTDEANTRHAINSAHLGILTTQASFEPYTKNFFLSDVLYMLDYTNFLPNNPNWGTYRQATFDALARVQAGKLTAQEAVDFVVGTLRNQLGNEIIVLE